MRTLLALLMATFLVLTACGDDGSTPVTAGTGDDTETTDAPPETTDAPPATVVDGADPDGDEAAPSGEQLEAELAAARTKWAEVDPQRYTMELSVVCFCPVEYVGPFEVTVTDGAVSNVAYAPGALTEAEIPPADAEILTVDEIFDVIDDAIGTADEVRVSYDAETGVPTEVWIDASFQMADEEIGYTVVVDAEG